MTVSDGVEALASHIQKINEIYCIRYTVERLTRNSGNL